MVQPPQQPSPQFRISVIKYCRDALSRQVGEAVRVGYRGQTLNSKGGYNRSALCRLVLDESKDGLEREGSGRMEEQECPEPKGLSHGGWKTGMKRKEIQDEELHHKPKKRRKLKFQTLPEDWGMEDGKLAKLAEEVENSRRSFGAGI